MLTYKEKEELLKEHFTDSNGDIDLRFLNLTGYKVLLTYLKADVIDNSRQNAKTIINKHQSGNIISNKNQEAETIYNEDQDAKNIYNDNQYAKENISNLQQQADLICNVNIKANKVDMEHAVIKKLTT